MFIHKTSIMKLGGVPFAESVDEACFIRPEDEAAK